MNVNKDDIQAEENKRREVAVRAGASPIATKYEPSPYKDLIKKLDDEAPNAQVAEEFGELQKNDPKPGFNFVSGPTAIVNAEEIIRRNQEAIKDDKKNSEDMAQLLKRANENDLKVTRTATGQPNVDKSGKIVPPIQGDKPGDNPNPASNPNEASSAKVDEKSAFPATKDQALGTKPVESKK